MESENATRRLAAILVADIAGYSSLMGADEDATVAALKGHQAALLPLIAGSGGRVIDLAGDGILAEFPSVLGAVRAAVAMQATMVERNAAAPAERRMDFRIGINLGDVIYDDARIYGDGINVAARLQAIAEPGGICLSGKVYDEVVDRIDGPFTDLGPRELKNIARPVRVYALGGSRGAHASGKVAEGALLAVLPFQNMSADAEQEYFADGVVEEIITALSRFKSFAVIARNSSFVYKGRAVDVRTAARELGVRYVLEGSVRRAGDALRITAQLNDGDTGTHLWAKTYDGSVADIFEFQDRITQNVVGVIEPTIRQSEIERSRRERPDSLAAYDLTLRALPRIYSADPEEHAEAFRLLEQAISIEPDYGLALIHAAFVLSVRGGMGWSRLTADDKAMTRDLARRALANDGGDARTYALGAIVLSHAGREHERSVQLIEKALEANPNDPNVLVWSSIVLLHCGNVDEALAHGLRVIALTPSDPMQHVPLTAIAHIHMIKGNFAEALVWAERSAAHRADYDSSYWMLIAANVHLGQMQAARAWLEKFRALRPSVTVASIRDGQPAFDPERMRAILEGLRLAGLPEEAAAHDVLPSLAVLPFQNLSADPEQDYFADGVAQDIITALSRFRSFTVVAGHSSFVYSARGIDVRRVAADLGVRYVLEGSVRRLGGKLRITVQLIDAASGAHLWAQSFDGAIEDVFTFQDRITESIVSIVEPSVKRAEIERARHKAPNSLDAYDLYLQALAVVLYPEPEANVRAIALIERSLSLDPTFAPALAIAASAYLARFDRQLPGASDADRLRGLGWAQAALAASGNDPNVRAIAGLAVMTLGDEFDSGMLALRQAVGENPNSVSVLGYAGIGALHAGGLDEAERYLQRAIDLNLNDSVGHWNLCGMAHLRIIEGKYEEALDWATRCQAINRSNHANYWMLAAANAHLGRMSDARRWREALQALLPDTNIARIRKGQRVREPGRIEPILDGLRLAGLPEDAPAGPILPSLAVLPFQNMSGDAEQDYFADGIADDITTALSRFRAFAVIARNSSFSYKGRSIDVRETARDLGVRYVLEGNVRRGGDKLRVTAQLVDGTTGAHLWGRTFDGPLDNVFDVQDRITESVAALVGPRIDQAELARAQRERPGSLAVYDLYLRALQKSETAQESENAAAIELLDRALAIEPRYVPALALAAHARETRTSWAWPAYRDDDRETGLRQARLALDLAGDDGVAIARASMALFQLGGERDRAVRMIERAVDLNPNNAFVVMHAAIVHVLAGDLDKAWQFAQRVTQLNLSETADVAMTVLAHVELIHSRYDEALDWATRALSANPNFLAAHWMRVAALAYLGRVDEARRGLRELMSLSPGLTLSRLRQGNVNAKPGRHDPVLEGLRLAGMPEDAPKGPILPSIAVLPFQNMSGDAEQDYFADGVVDEIITALSRFKSFAVIARNSSFAYKGRAVDVRQIGKDLGVRYVVEGSIRRAGERVRITAQLVDAETGAHLWAEHFEGAVADVFEFQDRITESIVVIIEPQVRRAEIERARRERPGSVAGYDLYLRAVSGAFVGTRDDTALVAAEQAVALDPGNATYLAVAATLMQHRISMGWESASPERLAQCAEYIERALAAGRSDAVVVSICGNTLIQLFRQYDRGFELVRQAFSENPNNLQVVAHAGIGHLLCGDLDAALDCFERAVRLNPRDQTTAMPLTGLAHTHIVLGNYEEALAWANKSLAALKDYDATYWMLIAANAHLGRMTEARRHLADFRKLAPQVTIASIRAGQARKDPGRIEPILDGLRLAGLPETAPAEPVLPSLAVLPFANMSGDPEQDYFADGAVEDIITALSRFRSFAVIARNSSFLYKGRAVDVRQVAKDLGVRYVLEGSVRRAGNKLRITAQLVDGTTGVHLWAQHFDGAVDDIFDFQDSITGQVSALVEPQVMRAEIERSRSERPESVAVYDLYLRSLPYFNETTRDGYRAAYALIQQALALDPDNPLLMARALRAIDHTASMGWPPLGPNDQQVALDLVARIGHSDQPEVRTTLGMFLVHRARDYDRGLAIVENALAANPNNLMTVTAAGIAYLHCGDLDESLACFNRAITLSPRDTAAHFALTGIAHVHMARREYEEALRWAEKSLAINGNFNATFWMLIAASAHLKRWTDAERYLAAFRTLSPGLSVATIRDSQPAKYAERMAAILEGLRLAGMPEEDAPTGPVLPSLAVLPFQNMSGDPEQEYFADGIVEDIITALSRFKSFAVIARNSSFAYKGRTVDVRKAAEELNVRYVLEGSVRRSGARLRISAQLIDGRTGSHLWAEHFDGGVEDIFTFQDRIAESAVAVVAPTMRKAEIERTRLERPDSIDAYDLLMRGMQKLNSTRGDENAEAISLLEQAVARDPRNAVALAYLANAYEHRYSMGWPGVSEDDGRRATELAHKALALGDDNPNVMGLCGLVLLLAGGEAQLALSLVERAYAANPNDIEVLNHAGIVNQVTGNFERAVALFRRAIELSPADTALAKTNIAIALVGLDRYEEALDYAHQSLAESTTFNPTYWALIAANGHLGRLEAAHAALEALRAFSPNVALDRIAPGRGPNTRMRQGLLLGGMPEH